jgi:DNA end-binding protein Ku
MATRAYWSGRIRLALVSIPVQLIPATKSSAKISFNQIHKPSGKRIRYEKVVPGLGPVDTDDIVKGYEVEKGKYVLLEDQEIEDVKLEAKKSVDLVQFVDEHSIDPVYFEKPFFVLPDEDNEDGVEAYIVLRDALKKAKKVGIGQIVVRGQSSLVALKASGKGLMIETLRYADEVQKADKAFSDIPSAKPNADLIEMAEELIEKKSGTFDPTDFKDKYQDALRELIDAKLEKRAPQAIEEPERGSNVIDLMEALKRSVGREGKGKKKYAAKSASRGARKSSKRSVA